MIPDLRPHFRHYRWEAMSHSRGVLVGRDWSDKAPDDPVFGIHTQSGSWTMDETAILFDVAREVGGMWLDIGGATGWTAAHIAKAGCQVIALDPMYNDPEFMLRASSNLNACGCQTEAELIALTSGRYFAMISRMFDGVVIDGDHEGDAPLADAIGALKALRRGGAILLHDVVGAPVQRAVQFLRDAGLEAAIYDTAHGVAVCRKE